LLDTYGRRYVDPVLTQTAGFLVDRGFSANGVTGAAFLIGITSGPLIYLDYPLLAVAVLWVSGFLDAADGAMARMTKPSAWGTVLDVTFDRVVEISVIVGLAFRFPQASRALLLLSVSIIVSMTVFLTVGGVAEKKGVKSFYYQPGLMERTDGFIFFSLMMLFGARVAEIALIFAGAILFTACQRLREAKRILGG
jgi:archaetidylinositol phosphate synthase